METAGYAALSRQSGLIREMQVVANNIANSATTGYRQEGVVFSEYVRDLSRGDSISMARADIRNTSMEQGPLTQTNGQFDLAIEGDGYFMVETPDGERLTRSGNFSPNADGDLVTVNGARVLDSGGAPVFVPPNATTIHIAPDGTFSADGQPQGQIGLYQPVDPFGLMREDGVLFRSESGAEPAENARVVQGFLEGSNVNAITQVARMIEVQRAYEMGQSFLQAEDQRIRDAVKNLLR